jgi:hypothetical protein
MTIIKNIILFLGLSLCVQLGALGQGNDYKKFVDTVKSLYSDSLTFNDASLNINGVELANSPVGIAFAYFNAKNNKRYILINYQYLFRKIWQDPSLSHKNNVLKVILAHEWSHHYLGHTFQKLSVINERNADILAGRILAEDGNLDIENDPSVIQFFKTLPSSQHHLPAKMRLDLLEKGNLTHMLIKKNLNELKKDINTEAEKSLKNKKKQLGFLKLSEVKLVVDSLELAQKQLLFGIANDRANLFEKIQEKDSTRKMTDWFITNFTDFSRVIRFKETLPSNDTIINNIKQEVLPNLLEVNLRYKIILDSLKSKANTSISKIKSDYTSKIDSLTSTQFISDTSPLLEALYNKWYTSMWSLRPPDSINILRTLAVSLPDTNTVLTYKLNGGIIIKIILTEKKASKPILMKIGEVNYQYTLLKNNENGYPYYFKTHEGEIFYLDTNYQLWCKTLAARSIQDKLFLQRYEPQTF